MPTFGNAAAKTALPHPPRTSQKVPKNSAPYLLISSSFEDYAAAFLTSRTREEIVIATAF
jgi:hypothetical protein